MIEFAPISKKPMSYDEAVLYCVFCTHGGHTNWRLPTEEEYHESNNIWRSWYQDEAFDGSVYNAMPVRDI